LKLPLQSGRCRAQDWGAWRSAARLTSSIKPRAACPRRRLLTDGRTLPRHG
jgi:hypothetical protein